MKHILIQIDPPQLAGTNINGFPRYREVGDPSTWSSPEGYIYVPVLAEPEEDPVPGKVWVRNLTITEYGWAEIDADLEDGSNEYQGFEITGCPRESFCRTKKTAGEGMIMHETTTQP